MKITKTILFVVLISLSHDLSAKVFTYPKGFLEKLEKLDAFGNQDLNKKSLKYIYQSPTGFLVSKSCRSFSNKAAKLEYGQDPDFYILEKLIYKSASAVMNYLNYHPELHKYLSQWVSSLRRTKLHCKRISSKKYYFYSDTKFNITAASLESFLNFFLGKDLFLPVQNHLRSLIHEVFHSTSANNRNDHNRLGELYALVYTGGIYPGPEGDCHESYPVDRVYSLSLLISEKSRYKSFNLNPISHHQLMEERVKRCGIQHCLDIFAGNFSNTPLSHMTTSPDIKKVEQFSENLSEENALAFCKQFQKENTSD